MLSPKMTCPACGVQLLPDQKFCRSCGASLQMTTQPLAARGPLSEPESRAAAGFQIEGQSRNSLVLWGFITMFIGAAIGVLGKKLLHQDIVTVVGIFISLLGMFLTVYPYLSPARPKKYISDSPSRPEAQTPSPTSKHLPPASIGNIPSITERTTDLLNNSSPTRPPQKEDRNWQGNSESGELN